MFKRSNEDPKILIVTDKLLTGFDAPLLYCMYLDKPMRDHVLLQAIARVNRPYVDGEGVSKSIGLVVDFVGGFAGTEEGASIRLVRCQRCDRGPGPLDAGLSDEDR